MCIRDSAPPDAGRERIANQDQLFADERKHDARIPKGCTAVRRQRVNGDWRSDNEEPEKTNEHERIMPGIALSSDGVGRRQARATAAVAQSADLACAAVC